MRIPENLKAWLFDVKESQILFCKRAIAGNLPPNPELADAIDRHWREYRELGIPKRIKPKSIKHNSSSSRLEEIRNSGEKVGVLINQWLKSEQFRDIDTGLREELSPTEKVRVLVRTQDNYLRKFPWHLWDFIEMRPKLANW